MKVLVVEDGPGRAALLAEQLDAAAPGDFELVGAGTLTEIAALLLGIDRPAVDCIVLTLADPDLQALTRLRTAALATPVVVWGGGDDVFALACVQAGAQDHVDPGADGPALARALRHAVERRRRENAVLHQALHDPLTALPNRTLFFDRLHQALGRLDRTQTALAVLFLDLDRFKEVNDTRGHAAGDALLHDVAVRLVQALRGGDTAARIGGDEFVVLGEDVSGPEEACALGERLLAELPTRASMGIALATSPDVDAEALVRQADAAMYRVKRRGGGGVELAGDGATTV
jgi:diguanylate cyclase (GGDEF)-like protein